MGRACATNKVALLVPCHRVVPEQGGFAGYRWGERVKRALLTTEGATLPPDRATAQMTADHAARGKDDDVAAPVRMPAGRRSR